MAQTGNAHLLATCSVSMGEGEVSHIQASFFTKDSRYSVQDTSFSLPVNVTQTELSSLINQLLQSNEVDQEDTITTVKFNFLINGELIRESIEDHVTTRGLSTENVIEIEYVEQQAPPSLSVELSHQDWVSCAHCSKRFILSGCYNNSVNVWKHDGELVCTAREHIGSVKDVKWVTRRGEPSDEEGLLFLSASQDQNINLWQLSSDGELEVLHEYKGHARSVEAIAVSPDSTKFCSASWDTFLKIWSAVPDSGPGNDEGEDDPPTKRLKPSNPHHSTTRTPIVTFQGHGGAVTAVEWAREEEVVTAGWDNCVRVWDVDSGENKTTLTGSKVFHDISLSPLNGLVASGNSDKLVRIWDPRAQGASMIQTVLSSHQGWVVCVNWSPVDENQLLSGSYDSTLKLWDVRSNKLPLYTISAHEGKVLCSDWSLSEIFVSGGEDNKLRTYVS